MTAPTRAAIYLRTAGRSAERIQEQRDACTACATGKGWTIVAEYVDDGVSGVRSDPPGLVDLLAAIEVGACDTVIVRDLARTSGNPHHATAFLRKCGDAGVTLVNGKGADLSAPSRLASYLPTP